MKKIISFLLLFTVGFCGFTQENKTPFSIDFNAVSLKSSLEKIESATNYKFYFDVKWIEENQNLYTLNIKNATIESILDTLLEQSDLNYFIDERKIILTKNLKIRTELAVGFYTNDTLSKPKTDPIKNNDTPLFYKEYNLTNTSDSAKIEQVIIGKEGKTSSKNFLTLSGRITNLKTREALPNVGIKVQNTSKSTVTDGSGFYSIDLASGIYVIEFQSLNFKKAKKRIVLYSDGTLNANLEEIINQLDEVIVNNKKDEKLKSTISGATIIEVEKIKTIPLILGERDIFKVAAALPGIKNVGEGASGYSVRGGKEDQNLVLLDHGLLYNPSHFFGLFSAVNPFTTKKAIVYKGNIPAEFGGRLSSVFDISTKSGNLKKISGEAGIGPVTSNVALEIPVFKDKSSLLVAARATYSGWILRSLKDTELQKSEASFYDVIAKYFHKIDAANSVESTFYHSKDRFSISSDSLYQYTNRLFSVNWNHSFNDKHKSNFIFTNSEYQFNIDYDSNNEEAFYFGYKINESQFQAKFNYNRNDKLKFSYGISSKLYKINPGNFKPKEEESLLLPIDVQREQALESAAYLSANYKISEKLLVELGLRYSIYAALGKSTQRIYQSGLPLNDATVIGTNEYDQNEIIKSYGGIEPRVSARYFITDDFSVKGGYDKTYQYVHLLSNNTTQSPTDTWKLSDSNVKPQVAQQFSVGLFKNISKSDLELSVEGYYKKSSNFLDYKVASQLLLNENIETELLQGEGKAYGLEFLVKKTSGKLNGWIGYTYSRTFIKLDSAFNEERVNNGNYFPANFDKPHDVSVVLNYKTTKRYSFSANFVYQTGRPITFPIGTYTYGNAEYTLYSDRNQYRIPDYFRLDLGFNVEGNHKIKKLAHSFWNISIYNLLGRNNPYAIYFVTQNGEIKAYKSSIFAIPVPTITYNFKF